MSGGPRLTAGAGDGRPGTLGAVLVYLAGFALVLTLAPARGITIYVLTSGIVCIAAPIAARRHGRGTVSAGLVGLILPAVLLVAELGLAYQTQLARHPLDARLASMDALLTGSAAGQPMRWAAAHPALGTPVSLLYLSLVIPMAVIWCRRGLPLRPIVAVALCGFIALPLYALAPAIGPYAAKLSPPELRLEPRNAFPSVHVALSLLWLWAAWPMGRRWRWAAGAFSAGTVAAVLLTGQHYVVDLVGAPSLAAGSAWLVEARWRRAAVALSVVLVWAVSVRLDAGWMRAPALLWLAALVSVSAPLLIARLDSLGRAYRVSPIPLPEPE